MSTKKLPHSIKRGNKMFLLQQLQRENNQRRRQADLPPEHSNDSWHGILLTDAQMTDYLWAWIPPIDKARLLNIWTKGKLEDYE